MNRIKISFWIILPLAVLAIFVWPKSTNRLNVDVNQVPYSLNINRFDSVFFNTDIKFFEDEISILREEYPMFFKGTSNEFWYFQRNDDVQNKLYNEVKKVKIETEFSDLKNMLKHFAYFYPNGPKYQAISYISNLDINNPIIVTDSVETIFIASDLYLGRQHLAYKNLDAYLAFYRDKQFITSEVAENLAIKLAAVDNNDLTLLNQMVWWGKIMYAKTAFMPNEQKDIVMRYDPEKLKFSQNNELEIWLYFVKNNLIYNTEEKVKRRFIYLAPFSKFYTDFDNHTPGMIGQWIGYRIVQSYMENNSEVTLQELLANKNHKEIFNQSKYRP